MQKNENILTSGLVRVFKITKSIVSLQKEDGIYNICPHYLL